MPAPIKISELSIHPAVRLQLGAPGLSIRHAKTIMRDIVRDGWPTQRRPAQSVYVIRLVGEVAVAYPAHFSPVIYIGEGNAYARLHGHIAVWIAPLLLAVPQLALDIRICEIARKNHSTLYKHIEADLLRWFSDEYGALPWFNRQWETGKEGRYDYKSDAESALWRMVTIGSGSTYVWAIKPTHNNEQHKPFAKGTVE